MRQSKEKAQGGGWWWAAKFQWTLSAAGGERLDDGRQFLRWARVGYLFFTLQDLWRVRACAFHDPLRLLSFFLFVLLFLADFSDRTRLTSGMAVPWSQSSYKFFHVRSQDVRQGWQNHQSYVTPQLPFRHLYRSLCMINIFCMKCDTIKVKQPSFSWKTLMKLKVVS